MGNLRNSLLLWRRALSTLLLFGFAISVVCAQERTITGQVTAQTEGPLAGVNIVLQGTTQGTQSDANGNYTIKVPGPDAVLVFSFISFTSQSVTVGTQTKINVVMVPATSTLNEVVVIGYGTQKKNELTSSVANVKSDQFNQGYVQAPEQLIQGKVAGLSISKPGGDPNATYNIRLRGLNTVGANTQPLIVIDGIVGGDLSNVDPNDIESINVLKDGSGAAIYGTRGSSGVILVTTKKGKSGVAQVEYNGYVTAEMVAKNTDVMNATQWRALSQEVGKGTDFGGNTDWFKAIEQTAWSQVHNLSMSGGTDKTTYRASVNYRNSEGVEIHTGYSQLNGRINVTQKALNDKLTLELNLGATQKNAELGFPQAFKYATIYNPTAPITSTDPAYTKYGGYFQQVLFDYYNPVAICNLDKNDAQYRILNVSLKGTYQIIKGLAIDAFYATTSNATLGGQYYAKTEYWNGMNRNGLASQQEDNTTSQLFESTIHYAGDITSAVNLTVLGGYSYQAFINQGFYAQGGNFLLDDFSYNNLSAAQDFNNGLGTVTSYKNSNKIIAFFGRVNLNILNNWFVSASARYEGSSRFGSANKWGLFPAIGGGVDLAKMIDVSWIDNLKVRVNYGITGNQPSSSYLSVLQLGPNGYVYDNGNYKPVYSPSSNANPDLKWEKKGEFDAGFDFSVLKSKVTGSFDYYTRTTTDLLWQYNVPVPPNLFTSAWMNLGKIKSSGLELSLSWAAVKKSDFSYMLSITPSYSLENTLVSLSGTFNGATLTYGQQDLSDMGSPGQNQVPLTRVQEGKPIGQILALQWAGVDPSGNATFVDQNHDGKIDQADRVIVGNGLPKFLMGWGNTFTYKNWDLNIFFRGVFGHDLVNSFEGFYQVPQMIGSYNLPVDAASLRNPVTGVLMNSASGILSSKDVQNASFVSLDNLSLGYNFKMAKTCPVNKIRVYVAGNKLFYITKYKGTDPEPRYVDSATDMGTFNSPLVPGIDRRDGWFRTRSFTFGVNVVF
ncbi:MAG: SusC/RagA family TonB-linked outer membrane protein [Bacteroidales bacterium]|jgi:iron complex outermembrane receptor protein